MLVPVVAASLVLLAACWESPQQFARGPNGGLPDAEALRARVASEGPRQVVKDIFSDTRVWEHVLGQISTGAPTWIKLAGELRAGTDGASAEDLFGALSEALPQSPAQVLQVIDSPFQVQLVCANGETLGDSYAQARATIKKRRDAVLTVKTAGLKEKRDECVKALVELEILARQHEQTWPH